MLKGCPGQICNNNQINKLAMTINLAAFLINCFSSSQTVLKITTKSGLRQSTISIRKNDLVLRNIVWENTSPINRAIKPEAIVNIIIEHQPHTPNNRLDT
jgi:hypothetical protein